MFLAKLLSKFKKVIVAYDGDEAGREGSAKLSNLLCVYTNVEVLELPEGEDPDKLCEDDLKYIRSRIGK